MKSIKKTSITVLLVSAMVMGTFLGCDTEPQQVTFPNQINAVMGGAASIAVIESNLGSELGELVTHNPESIAAGDVPYLPVLLTSLYSGTTPYLSFTFDKAIKQVFASTYDTATNEFSGDAYVFDVAADDSFSKKLLSGLPVISGTTVRFNLPVITDHGTGTANDGETFVEGNRYLVDFFVQSTAGELGRVTVAFFVKEQNIAIGTLTDLAIYGKTAAQEEYSLYQIDSERAFFLYDEIPATHTAPAIAAESVQGNATIFNTYENRYADGNSTISPGVYQSLDALAEPINARTLNYVELTWSVVANATEYQIYTTDSDDLISDWVYVDTVAAGTDPELPESYNFPISTHTIGAYRMVRVVPVNNLEIGQPAHIQLIDEVRPVTGQQDNQSSADSFQIAAVFANHQHGLANTEGEIIGTGTRDLGAIVQPDYSPEAYQITNVTGTLAVATTANNGAILPLNAADVEITDTERAFQLGANAVGVLDAANVLTVYVRVACYLSPAGTITYIPANSTVSGNLSVTYADLAGNLMISLTSSAASKNTGVIVYVEQ